ncbi:MAG TPA: 50S ribosomal protein L9 [Bacillota bacterium]|nr:50S ribosomal protein L9 [Bacillota bacterium]
MKVILQQDVKGQGKRGQLVEVSEGYARNFLFPKNLAVEATGGNMKTFEQQKKSQEKRQQEEKGQAEKFAKELENITITIPAKTGEGGRLFGAVSTKQISDALKKANLDIDKRKLVLDEPIKTLGYTKIPVKLYPDVMGTLNVHVVEEK